MLPLSPRGLGFAFGAIWAVFYAGCAFVMATVPRDVAIRFFNSLTHGVDWGPIMRWNMPWTEALAGLLGVLQLEPDAFLQAGAEGKVDGAEVEALIAARLQARAEKNWAESDRIRDQLTAMGVVLEDGKGGTTWRLAE